MTAHRFSAIYGEKNLFNTKLSIQILFKEGRQRTTCSSGHRSELCLDVKQYHIQRANPQIYEGHQGRYKKFGAVPVFQESTQS